MKAPRFAALSKICPLTILRLPHFFLRTNFRISSKSRYLTSRTTMANRGSSEWPRSPERPTTADSWRPRDLATKTHTGNNKAKDMQLIRKFGHDLFTFVALYSADKIFEWAANLWALGLGWFRRATFSRKSKSKVFRRGLRFIKGLWSLLNQIFIANHQTFWTFNEKNLSFLSYLKLACGQRCQMFNN